MHHGCLQTKSEKYARIRRHAPQPTGQSCPTPLRRVITRPRPKSDIRHLPLAVAGPRQGPCDCLSHGQTRQATGSKVTKSSTRGSEPEGTSFKQRAGASWMMDCLNYPLSRCPRFTLPTTACPPGYTWTCSLSAADAASTDRLAAGECYRLIPAIRGPALTGCHHSQMKILEC
jgi:hypothetical protein